MDFEQLNKESILNDICEFYKLNYGQEITQAQASALPMCEQLQAYLNYNGIFGYSDKIILIFKGLK